MGTMDPQIRLAQLEAAIEHHREEKSSVPDCTCWITHAQRQDAELYALLGAAGTLEERVAALEEGIRKNRHSKKEAPDCPCWGNAPQGVDAELYGVLESSATKP